MDLSVCVARGSDGWQVAVRAEELAVITCPGDDDILERWVEVMEKV